MTCNVRLNALVKSSGCLLASASLLLSVGSSFAGSLPDESSDSWTCTYANEKKEPQTTKLVVSGDDLIQNNSRHYRILANNETGLVAAYGYSLLGTSTKPTIAGLSIIIERQSGNFRLIGATNYMDFAPVNGHCIQN